MKTYVVGPGGVGGYFGGMLARDDFFDVSFVARGEHAAAIAQHGLTVNSVAGNFAINPAKVCSSQQIEDPDLIFITTKAYSLEEAATGLRGVLRDDTIVIPIQNGLDHDLVVRNALGTAEVYPGIAYIISQISAPGVISQTAGPRELIIGDRDSQHNQRLEELVSRIRKAGVNARFGGDIERELWQKAVFLNAFGGVSALCRTPVGVLLADPNAKSIYEQCMREVIATAEASGVPLDANLFESMLDKSLGYLDESRKLSESSMLTDVLNGRQTEVEQLHGSLVRIAAKVGVAVPIHQAIYAALKFGATPR